MKQTLQLSVSCFNIDAEFRLTRKVSQAAERDIPSFEDVKEAQISIWICSSPPTNVKFW